MARTYSGLHFFRSRWAASQPPQKQLTVYSAVELDRILFVFAKLHPEVAYVQGMNELVAPLFYVNCQMPAGDVLQEPAEHDSEEPGTPRSAGSASPRWDTTSEKVIATAEEADTFWCFSQLISPMLSWFIDPSRPPRRTASSADSDDSDGHGRENEDGCQLGLSKPLAQLQILLEGHDAELSSWLQSLDMKPEYFGIRWLTMLLAQDFELPELLRLWDTMLAIGCSPPGDVATVAAAADDSRQQLGQELPRGPLEACFSALGLDFILNFCCGMLLRQRPRLLNSCFERCLELLQAASAFSGGVPLPVGHRDRPAGVDGAAPLGDPTSADSDRTLNQLIASAFVLQVRLCAQRLSLCPASVCAGAVCVQCVCASVRANVRSFIMHVAELMCLLC